MEDINDWQEKYESCKYADRLLSKLSELNQQVTIPVNINEITKGIYYAKSIMVAKCDNPVIYITPIR